MKSVIPKNQPSYNNWAKEFGVSSRWEEKPIVNLYQFDIKTFSKNLKNKI
jgi:hypothetical protein